MSPEHSVKFLAISRWNVMCGDSHNILNVSTGKKTAGDSKGLTLSGAKDQKFSVFSSQQGLKYFL